MKEELAKFGLNSTEQEILMYLLRYGSRNAGVVAQKLNLKRPTVYSALENLIKANLVHKDLVGKSYSFRAAQPGDIPNILYQNAELKFEKLKFTLELLKRPLEEMAKFQNAKLGQFNIEVIESNDRYADLTYQHCAAKNHYSIWDPNVAIYDQDVKNRLEVFLDKSLKNKNKIREILVAGPETDWYLSKVQNKNHISKIIPSKMISAADLCLFEEDMTMISLNTPHSEQALVVNNKDLFNFMKQIFDFMWISI